VCCVVLIMQMLLIQQYIFNFGMPKLSFMLKLNMLIFLLYVFTYLTDLNVIFQQCLLHILRVIIKEY